MYKRQAANVLYKKVKKSIFCPRACAARCYTVDLQYIALSIKVQAKEQCKNDGEK